MAVAPCLSPASYSACLDCVHQLTSRAHLTQPLQQISQGWLPGFRLPSLQSRVKRRRAANASGTAGGRSGVREVEGEEEEDAEAEAVGGEEELEQEVSRFCADRTLRRR